DHGNADEMGSADEPHTAHTFNDVPFIYVQGEGEIDHEGELRDIAPTLLSLLDIEIPAEMTGKTLI
ncbi:MAG: 2,3-bisphosphoglycerate-independent phosphoglycerate mutase, partial [Halobacteria archaeon]|nr:2,3-bisphosphoglycerate-independent phosphoglycerate mutase [Halobacteria archaeon]